VGKSSLISRFIENNFNPQMMATPGAKFLSKKLYLESINIIADLKVN
jgi:GTPase SAR1 family protein